MSMLEAQEESESHGYFVPMIDMLAGVIFILIIMLAAVSLVSRNEFQQAGTMQGEIKQIQAELAQARQQEKTYIEPRRIARAAMALLLQRLQAELAAKGVSAQIFPDDGRLLVTQPALFGAGVGLTAEGQRVAGVIAGALDSEVPCLARDESAAAACAAYRHAHLDEASVVVAGSGTAGRDGQGAARALALLSTIAADRPALLLQQAVDKRRILDYRAEESVPAAVKTAPTASASVAAGPANPLQTAAATAAPAAPVPPAGTALAPVTPAEAALAPAVPVTPAEADTIELAFTMNVPPLPAEKK